MGRREIDALLKKKGWTGDEVGRAIIISLIDAYKQTLQGVANPKALFNSAQLRTMINSLKDRDEGTRYNRYVGLNNWISQCNAIATSFYEQVRGEVNRLLTIVSTATAAESEYKYTAKLPVIMTQKQYDEYRAQSIAETIEAYGEGTIINLIFTAICYYEDLLEKEPRKANPLKPIKKKYEAAAVKSERILSRWNETYQNGYYSLPDGRRSDQMTEEEWHKALFDTEEIDQLKQDVTALREGKSTAEILKNRPLTANTFRRVTSRNEAIYNGATWEEADSMQYDAETKAGLHHATEWHTYEEPPKDITKWDAFNWDALINFYPFLDGGDFPDFEEQLADFKREFGDAIDALITAIDKIYPIAGKGIKATPVKEWRSVTFSYRDLYEQDLFGVKAQIEDPKSIFDGNYRALFNGVAIIEPPPFSSQYKIDERGYYAEPEHFNSFASACGLEQFTPQNEDYITNVELLEKGKETIINGYYFLIGYDKAIELIADYIKLPDFTIFKMNTEDIADRINALNNLIFSLYAQIKATHYQDKEAQETKLQVLKDYLQPLEWEALTIPKERIKQAKAMLEDNMQAFVTQDGVFLETLTRREGV